MKNLIYLLVYCEIAMVANAQYSIKNTDLSQYQNMDFEIDFDFFGENKMARVVKDTADIGWRFLGADSYSFAKAKELLKDPHWNTEFALALLLIEKYPLENNSYVAITNFLIEMAWVELFNNFDSCKKVLLLVNNSGEFQKIYNLSRKLVKNERLAMIEYLLQQAQIIHLKDPYNNLPIDIANLEAPIKQMLTTIYHE